jgi:hypothetical protein
MMKNIRGFVSDLLLGIALSEMKLGIWVEWKCVPLVGASNLGSAANLFIWGFGTEVVVLGFFRSVGWCWDFYL